MTNFEQWLQVAGMVIFVLSSTFLVNILSSFSDDLSLVIRRANDKNLNKQNKFWKLQEYSSFSFMFLISLILLSLILIASYFLYFGAS
jgi:uncharacterized membrane protein YhaH (DUF805 family)